MAREIVLKPGESCPPGYVQFHYLGESRERCRPQGRYLLMPLDTTPERRAAWAGQDFSAVNPEIKERADDATYRAWCRSEGAWGLYDRRGASSSIAEAAPPR